MSASASHPERPIDAASTPNRYAAALDFVLWHSGLARRVAFALACRGSDTFRSAINRDFERVGLVAGRRVGRPEGHRES